MSTLGPLDWIICGGFFVAVFGLGFVIARRQKTQEQYFVGSRQMHWLAVGLSLFAATFSALSFIGLPREAAYADYHLYLAILFIPLWAAPFIGWLFVPLYHRLRLTSAYEYLERRFNRTLRLTASLLYGLYILGWMGSILFAVGVLLQAMFGLDERQMMQVVVVLGVVITVYTAAGGIEAIVWADVLRSIVLTGSMALVLILAVARVEGGFGTVWRLGMEHDKFQMFNFHFDPTVRNNFYSACAFGMFVYLAAHATTQASVQRYLATPTVAAARRSLVIRGAAIALGCLVFFLVGSTLFAFYHQGDVPRGFPKLEREEHLLPHFVLKELAVPGLAGLLLAGLFSATMSTVESGINSLAALVACDWLPGHKLPLRTTRLLSACFGLGVIAAALVAPSLGKTVFDIIIAISGALLGPLLGVFVLGMFIPRANAAGALIGLAAGAGVLGAAMFGSRVSPWWYGALTCVPTIIVGAAASLLFRPPPRHQVHDLVVVPWRDAAAPPVKTF